MDFCQRIEFRYSGRILTTVKPLESCFVNAFFAKSKYFGQFVPCEKIHLDGNFDHAKFFKFSDVSEPKYAVETDANLTGD